MPCMDSSDVHDTKRKPSALLACLQMELTLVNDLLEGSQ